MHLAARIALVADLDAFLFGALVQHAERRIDDFTEFDLERGNILVSRDVGLQMGTTPATREWCFLEL